MKFLSAIITHRELMNTSDWMFLVAIIAANVVPWGLFIWGLTQ